MEEHLIFTKALVELWSEEMDEQAWWILVEHLKECNAREMQELGREAYEILEALDQVARTARTGAVPQDKLDQLEQVKTLVKTHAIEILQAHESLAAKVQRAEAGMEAYKALFKEYDQVRATHRYQMDMRAVQLAQAREEEAVKKIEALKQAEEILRAAQQRADAIRTGK